MDFSPIKSNYLKQTLSETLTHYYPLAGKVKDGLSYIDCNDEGVYYVEAKVSYGLKEFLSQPDVQLIQLLTPNNPGPLESMSGNYVILVQHMPDAKLEFPCIVGRIRKAFAKVDNDFIEGIKGNEGYAKINECLKEYAELLHNIDMDNCLVLTSLRKAGIYEVDFGWGKPSWCYFCNPGFKSAVVLMDTRSGDRIEAIVSLSGQAMAIFELVPEPGLEN
ncbi:hypothetical protein RJ640_023631 [Escallonia rubra]|uniref:Uncharacterized protein n=1 Tax=Escallonia rubra TaxID=112253 RepID=A0AA88UJI1_9ASTE|nr:hypothetical protein RJ640_023631 [Escallonia rubra]